jgi:hypothetical protein
MGTISQNQVAALKVAFSMLQTSFGSAYRRGEVRFAGGKAEIFFVPKWGKKICYLFWTVAE